MVIGLFKADALKQILYCIYGSRLCIPRGEATQPARPEPKCAFQSRPSGVSGNSLDAAARSMRC